MSTNINLLLRREEELAKKKKKIKMLNYAAAGSLLGVGILSISIFLIAQFVVSSSEENRQKTEELVAKYQYQQASLYVLNNRVDNIAKILQTRKNLSKVASSLLSKVPDNLSVENFEVNDKSVIVVGQSKSLSSIADLINSLTDMVREKESIKSLILNSLALDTGKNIYRVSLKSDL